MITLEKQIHIISISILFGIAFMFIWSIFNAVFYQKKKSFIRLVFEVFLYVFASTIYFVIVASKTDGIISVYAPLFLIIGIIIYQKLYAKFFNRTIWKIIDKIYTKIILKIKIKLKRKPKRKKEQSTQIEGVLEWTSFNKNETNLK